MMCVTPFARTSSDLSRANGQTGKSPPIDSFWIALLPSCLRDGAEVWG
jgi:hypothetical protein